MKIKDINKPHCPHCNIPMELHYTMRGDQYICNNFAFCNGRMTLKEAEDFDEK